MADVCPLWLDHDEIGHDTSADGRSRTWMLLVYEDSTDIDALKLLLKDLDWDFAGICHDQDGVKAHHHIVCLFKDGRRIDDVAKDLNIERRWLRAWDRKKKALRYLCHKDNESKFQYDASLIYGSIAEKAAAACAKGDQASEKQSVEDLMNFIDSIDGYISYSFLIKEVNKLGLFSVFRRMGIIAVRLVDSHNEVYRRLEEINPRQKALERFGDYEENGGAKDLTFGERLQRLDRKNLL